MRRSGNGPLPSVVRPEQEPAPLAFLAGRSDDRSVDEVSERASVSVAHELGEAVVDARAHGFDVGIGEIIPWYLLCGPWGDGETEEG